MLESGVDRIITQVVDPKMNHTFRPHIETAIHDFLSGDRKEENSSGSNSVPCEKTEPQEPVSISGAKTPWGLQWSSLKRQYPGSALLLQCVGLRLPSDSLAAAAAECRSYSFLVDFRLREDVMHWEAASKVVLSPLCCMKIQLEELHCMAQAYV